MKRYFTLFVLVSLFSACLWAADATVKETYATAPTGGAKTSRFSFDGRYTKWYYNYARSKTSDKIDTDRAFWTDHKTNSADNKDCYLETTLEGGLKAVSFKWQQGNTADYPDNLYMSIEINDAEADKKEQASVNASIAVNTYNHTFELKEDNIKFAIFNRSTTTRENPTDIGRILIGPITFTPYLLYTQKDVTIGIKQQGYYNDELINNTGSEGSISYSSSATGVATIDEYGVITPVSAGDAIITATWSEGVTTSYTLHVVDGIIAENFSKVKQTGQTASAEWNGDLFVWEVANVRRGVDDTLGLNPRIQATALRSNTGSSLVTKEVIEGGVKHIAFDWRQWASGTTPLTIDMYYSTSKDSWGDAVATQSENAVSASTPHSFSEDIDDGTKGNAYLKLNYTSGAGVAVLGALKITPWLLYTTKEATLDTRVNLTYTNTGLINNTTGDAPEYSINPVNAAVSISSEGQVAVEDGAEVNGDFTVTAAWSNVSTTYTLHVISRTATTASYANDIKRVGLDALAISNPLTYTESYDGTIEYSSSNTTVATVNPSTGVINLAGGVGQTTITATLPQTDNYKAASASFIIYVRDNNATIKEHFKNVINGTGSISNKDTIWTGVAFDWKPQGAIRHNSNDTIWGNTASHRSVWIATSTGAGGHGVLGSKEEIEGGIKYLSFYWKQWGSENNRTLRLAVFAGNERKGFMEYVPSGASTHEKFLLGVNNLMKNNQKLYIKNESYTGTPFDEANITSSNSRLIIDTVFITPWLLYTDKATQVMRIGDTYKRVPNINTTEGESGTLSYSSSDDNIASVASDGIVTAKARGNVIITAEYRWSESEYVTTTYPVAVYPVNCETFDGIEQTGNYSNTTPRVGDKATWTTSLGGFNVGDCSALTTNLVRFRAPINANENAYIESSAIEGGIASMTFDWNIGGAEGTTEWDIRILVNGREVKRLNNSDITATNAMDHFEQITINEINEPDNFTIRFENRSTVGGTYPTGNKARLLIDNIVWTNYEGTKVLTEETANDGWIRANGGQTRSVTINRSALVANVWNTLCLPFAISKSTDLGGAEVQRLANASLDGNSLTIAFSALDGDELAANTPYLVMPTSNKDISGTYENKTIGTEIPSVAEGPVTMQGIYSPTPLKKDDYSTLFVGNPVDGKNLFYPSIDSSLKGFRAYFKITDPNAANAPIRYTRFIVNQQDVVTEIDENGTPLPSSRKEIENGTLVIIRDGVRYDVLGRKK